MLEELRQDVWACNLELPKQGLVKMTSGNVSGRDPQTNLVVIKPSGYTYEQMTPQDMVVVDLEGNVVEGHLKPSADTAPRSKSLKWPIYISILMVSANFLIHRTLIDS